MSHFEWLDMVVSTSRFKAYTGCCQRVPYVAFLKVRECDLGQKKIAEATGPDPGKSGHVGGYALEAELRRHCGLLSRGPRVRAVRKAAETKG